MAERSDKEKEVAAATPKVGGAWKKYKMHGPLLHFGSTSKTALKKMRAPAFRPRGRQWVIHEIAGVATDDWEALPFEQKMKAVQEYYIQLAKKPSLPRNLRKHLNAMKRWFNIQRRTHKPWRSRIQSFFKRVKRIQDQKKLRGEKEASQSRTLRRALVRLAYQEPELRRKLLPLILGK